MNDDEFMCEIIKEEHVNYNISFKIVIIGDAGRYIFKYKLSILFRRR
jgi:hypothetical protein